MLLFVIAVLYIHFAASVVDRINDHMLFEGLSLKQAIHELNIYRKIMLVIGLPVVLVFGLMIYIINLIFYFKIFK